MDYMIIRGQDKQITGFWFKDKPEHDDFLALMAEREFPPEVQRNIASKNYEVTPSNPNHQYGFWVMLDGVSAPGKNVDGDVKSNKPAARVPRPVQAREMQQTRLNAALPASKPKNSPEPFPIRGTRDIITGIIGGIVLMVIGLWALIWVTPRYELVNAPDSLIPIAGIVDLGIGLVWFWKGSTAAIKTVIASRRKK
jgi:hypothetical protein